MKLSTLVCTTILCVISVSGTYARAESDLPLIAPDRLPMVTYIKNDGTALSKKETEDLSATTKNLSNLCAKQLASQLDLTTQELKHMAGNTSQDAVVRFAWNTCLSDAFRRAEDVGLLPNGIKVIFVGR